MPKIAMLEGYQAVSVREMRLARRGRGLGTIGCEELDVAVTRLGTALEQARSAGASQSDPRYQAALAFFEKHDSFWRSEWFTSSATCRNLVGEASTLINDLNGLIASRGGQTVRVPSSDLTPTGTPFSALSDIKWIALGLAGLVTVIYVGPVIARLAKPSKKRKS